MLHPDWSTHPMKILSTSTCRRQPLLRRGLGVVPRRVDAASVRTYLSYVIRNVSSAVRGLPSPGAGTRGSWNQRRRRVLGEQFDGVDLDNQVLFIKLDSTVWYALSWTRRAAANFPLTPWRTHPGTMIPTDACTLFGPHPVDPHGKTGNVLMTYHMCTRRIRACQTLTSTTSTGLDLTRF